MERFAGGGFAVVRVSEDDPAPDAGHVAALTSLPIVLIAITGGAVAPAWNALSDVLVHEGDPSLDDIVATTAAHPLAAMTLALLLRGSHRRTLDDGLVAESAAYSVLQSGPEFERWRAAHPVRLSDDEGPRVRIERNGARLVLTLNRPARRNALDTRMRDELLDGLSVAVADPSVASVELYGDGPHFCAGGDLDEFGSRSDPATAHVIRLDRSVARVMAALRERTTVSLHGAAVGSGIELAAFAGSVSARPDTMISLPEISLGLIPGAGGTVSLPARVGRLRTAWLALSGRSIDAVTALEWGLVDRIDP